MIALLWFFLAVLASPFKSKSRLEAENAALRHQLIVLRRKVRGRARLTNNDRLFFVQLYRWFPSVLWSKTMPLKIAKREEFELSGNEAVHKPTRKRFSAHPGMPNISSENVVDVGDYQEYEIKQIASMILAERLKKK